MQGAPRRYRYLAIAAVALAALARPLGADLRPASQGPDSTPVPRVSFADSLRDALARYHAIVSQGGWAAVPRGPGLEPGARDVRIPALRLRLLAEGYGTGVPPADSSVYDEGLAAAVRRFQVLHGLEPDGVIGPGTRGALNVSAAARTRQIAANLARARGMRPLTGDRYLVVNIPAFALEAVEGGRTALRMRVIVGKKDWPTPIVSARIGELVFRPLWIVPRTIVAEELIPLARRKPGYLAEAGFRIFRDSVGGADLDPGSVDWTVVDDSAADFRFVQEPGPDNPLGGVKFVLRTPYDVFLHDTPARSLFERRRRNLSHGCVRLEKARELAGWLLPSWTADSIDSAMTTGRDRHVPLAPSVPVHLVYWTAWPEDGGLVAFREDVDHWDEKLPGRPPHPSPGVRPGAHRPPATSDLPPVRPVDRGLSPSRRTRAR